MRLGKIAEEEKNQEINRKGRKGHRMCLMVMKIWLMPVIFAFLA